MCTCGMIAMIINGSVEGWYASGIFLSDGDRETIYVYFIISWLAAAVSMTSNLLTCVCDDPTFSGTVFPDSHTVSGRHPADVQEMKINDKGSKVISQIFLITQMACAITLALLWIHDIQSLYFPTKFLL